MSNTILDSTPQKQCRTCGLPKPATTDFFNAVPAYISPDLLNPQCKVCRSETRKDKRAKKGVRKPQRGYTRTELGVEVPLTQGKVTIIDECDLDLVIDCKWSYGNRNTPNAKKHRYNEESGYAKQVILIDGKPKTIRLHRVIIERILEGPIPEECVIDHINGNPLDNRRENLRLATFAQNAYNSEKQGNGNNPYKGVSLCNDEWRVKKWTAQICINGEHIRLGHFHTAKEAALAYNEAAIKYQGEYAKLNDIE